MVAAENLLMELNEDFNLSNFASPQKFEEIKSAVNELIIHDFNRLVQLLYRVDVPETLLKQSLRDHPETDAAEIVTRMLIDRQIQKINYRNTSAESASPIPEDDRW